MFSKHGGSLPPPNYRFDILPPAYNTATTTREDNARKLNALALRILVNLSSQNH